MASRTTTDPIEILLEMGVDLDNLSGEEDYLSALMEAAATIEFQTKGAGDDRSEALRKEIIAVRKKRKAADPKFKAKTAKISKSSFKSKAKVSEVRALPSSALVPYQKPTEESVEESKIEKKNVKVDKSDKLLSSILKNIIAIKGLIKERLNVTKSIRDIERKNLQKKKRKAKEESLEKDKKGKGFLKKLKGALPQLSIFDTIFNWIKNVVLGKILVNIIEWMSDPKNKKKLDTLGRFLKDWWPALTAAFVLFATPLGSFIRTVVSGMARLTAFLVTRAIPALIGFAAKNPLAAAAIATAIGAGALAFRAKDSTEQQLESKGLTDATPKKQADELSKPGSIMETFTRGILPSLNEREGFSGGGMARGTDTVPAMLTPGEFVMSRGAVDKFGSGFMESINAAGGGTNKPRMVSGTTYASGGGYVGAVKPLLDFVSKGEGNYNSMNQGSSGNRIVGSTNNASTILGKNLFDMTIGEVRRHQNSGKLYAAGRYQITPQTMPNALNGTGLKDDDMFNRSNQDKMGTNLLLNKPGRERLSSYLMGKSNDIEAAQIDLAMEFASIPVPKNMRGHVQQVSAGQSYYEGKGGNAARHTVSETMDALRNSKATVAKSMIPSLDKVPAWTQEKETFTNDGNPNTKGYVAGDYVKGRPGDPPNTISMFEGFGWSDPVKSFGATSQGNVISTQTGITENSYNNIRIDNPNDDIDFSSLKGTSAFSDIFAGARAKLAKPSGQISSKILPKENSQLTPLPIEKISPTERLKHVPKNSTDAITMPPIAGFPANDSETGNVPTDPDFPTTSPSKLAAEVRKTMIANTLGGDFQ